MNRQKALFFLMTLAANTTCSPAVLSAALSLSGGMLTAEDGWMLTEEGGVMMVEEA